LDSTKQRFVNEARTASSLNHPNVATIYDIGEEDSRSFIAMELVEGERCARAASRAADHRAGAVAGDRDRAGLQAAHGKGSSTATSSPTTCCSRARAASKILDFGIARLAAPASRAPG